jgi:hypothetical protein
MHSPLHSTGAEEYLPFNALISHQTQFFLTLFSSVQPPSIGKRENENDRNP